MYHLSIKLRACDQLRAIPRFHVIHFCCRVPDYITEMPKYLLCCVAFTFDELGGEFLGVIIWSTNQILAIPDIIETGYYLLRSQLFFLTSDLRQVFSRVSESSVLQSSYVHLITAIFRYRTGAGRSVGRRYKLNAYFRDSMLSNAYMHRRRLPLVSHWTQAV